MLQIEIFKMDFINTEIGYIRQFDEWTANYPIWRIWSYKSICNATLHPSIRQNYCQRKRVGSLFLFCRSFYLYLQKSFYFKQKWYCLFISFKRPTWNDAFNNTFWNKISQNRILLFGDNCFTTILFGYVSLFISYGIPALFAVFNNFILFFTLSLALLHLKIVKLSDFIKSRKNRWLYYFLSTRNSNLLNVKDFYGLPLNYYRISSHRNLIIKTSIYLKIQILWVNTIYCKCQA